MSLSDIEIHKKLGIDLEKRYPVSSIRRVVSKDQDQQFDPEKRLKPPKKPRSVASQESQEPEDWVTLNQGPATDNSEDFWYHSYSGESMESNEDSPQTASSNDDDFILHIDHWEIEPE